MPVRCLNHVSRVCADVEKAAAFYRDLGFSDCRRPTSFDFDGAWLYSPHCSIGVHLIRGNPPPRPSKIDPKADHISFETDCLDSVEQVLVRRGADYIRQSVIEEDGVRVTQIFFHDPDNNMIEVCNCDDLPVVLLNDCQTCSAAAWERGQATKMDMAESGSRSIRNSSESVTMPLVLDAAMSMCSDVSMVMERV